MRRPVLAAAVLAMVMGSATVGIAAGATSADRTCRSAITKPYSNDEVVSYVACRADRQDAALKRVEDKLNSPAPTVTLTPRPGPTVTVTAGATERPTPTASSTGTAATPPAPSGSTAPSGSILFEDDFTGSSGALPDQSKWRDYSGCTNAKQAWGLIRCGNDETLTGTGQLSLPATPTSGSGLTTAGRYSFTYGTVSAWIKTPQATGYWPAFWTENRPSDFHDVPLYGEADALELYTFAPQYAHGNGIHAWDKNGQVWGGGDNYCTAPGVKDFGETFHKYTLKFQPDRITGYVDDVQCGPVVMRSSDPAQPWPFAPDVALQNYLILDLAVGGAGGQQPVPTKADVMLVDRVEVRAL